MADLTTNTAKTLVTVAQTNRYIFGDADVGCAGQVAIDLDTNGGTFTIAFQCKVPGASNWRTLAAYPADGTSLVTSTSTAGAYRVDASGVLVAVNVTATTGSPQVVFNPVVG